MNLHCRIEEKALKKIWAAFLFLGAALSLFVATPALSSRVSGLTKDREQLAPEDLEVVPENLGVSTIPAKAESKTEFNQSESGDNQQ